VKQDKIHYPCLPYSHTSQLICFRHILGRFPPNYKKQQGKHSTCVLETNLTVTDTIKLVFNRRETPTSAQVAQYFVCSKRRHLFQFSWSKLLHAHQQHSRSVTKSVCFNQCRNKANFGWIRTCTCQHYPSGEFTKRRKNCIKLKIFFSVTAVAQGK